MINFGLYLRQRIHLSHSPICLLPYYNSYRWIPPHEDDLNKLSFTDLLFSPLPSLSSCLCFFCPVCWYLCLQSCMFLIWSHRPHWPAECLSLYCLLPLFLTLLFCLQSHPYHNCLRQMAIILEPASVEVFSLLKEKRFHTSSLTHTPTQPLLFFSFPPHLLFFKTGLKVFHDSCQTPGSWLKPCICSCGMWECNKSWDCDIVSRYD